MTASEVSVLMVLCDPCPILLLYHPYKNQAKNPLS